jgi:hypothetical protein
MGMHPTIETERNKICYICTTVAVDHRGKQKYAINVKYEIQHTYIHYILQ